MKKHVYRVVAASKKGGFRVWVIDIEADSKREAKDIATAHWYEAHPDVHLFQVEAHLWDYGTLDFNFWHEAERKDMPW